MLQCSRDLSFAPRVFKLSFVLLFSHAVQVDTLNININMI